MQQGNNRNILNRNISCKTNISKQNDILNLCDNVDIIIISFQENDEWTRSVNVLYTVNIIVCLSATA